MSLKSRHAPGERAGRGPPDRVRGPPRHLRGGPLQAPGLREGRPVDRRIPRRCGRHGSQSAARHPERREVHRREGPGVPGDREGPGRGGPPGRDPARGPGAHGHPRAGSQEGPAALPGPRDRLRPRAGGGHPGRPPQGDEGLRRQDRGEHPAWHRADAGGRRARPDLDGDGDRRGVRGGAEGGARGAPVRVRRIAPADARDDRRHRHPRHRREVGADHGRVHRAAAGRGRHRARGHQDVDPHVEGTPGRPARRAARNVGRGARVLHGFQGAQHPRSRVRGPQEAQALRVRAVPRGHRGVDRRRDRGGGVRPPRDGLDPADAARGSRRGGGGARARASRPDPGEADPRRSAHAHQPDRWPGVARADDRNRARAQVRVLRRDRSRAQPVHAAHDRREDPEAAAAAGRARGEGEDDAAARHRAEHRPGRRGRLGRRVPVRVRRDGRVGPFDVQPIEGRDDPADRARMREPLRQHHRPPDRAEDPDACALRVRFRRGVRRRGADRDGARDQLLPRPARSARRAHHVGEAARREVLDRHRLTLDGAPGLPPLWDRERAARVADQGRRDQRVAADQAPEVPEQGPGLI